MGGDTGDDRDRVLPLKLLRAWWENTIMVMAVMMMMMVTAVTVLRTVATVMTQLWLSKVY